MNNNREYQAPGCCILKVKVFFLHDNGLFLVLPYQPQNMQEDFFVKNNIHITGNVNAENTIVWGHGFGTDQTSFSEVIKYFEKEYRIVLYDNVGGGKSDINAFSPLRYSTLNGYVSDLGNICRFLGLRNVIYVGHSVSGMIGMLTAIKHPEYFSKLVLLGASPRYLNDPSHNYTGGFNQEDLDALYEAMSANYYAWASGFAHMVIPHEDRPHLAEQFAATLSAIRADIALLVVRAIFESDHRESLHLCPLPALIIQTTDDMAVPEEVGEYLHRNIPGSTLAKVYTHGHCPQVTAPQELYRIISDYIQP